MPLLTYIPQILEEHFEELAFLLHLRTAQVSSGRMLYRQLIDLDDRISGHIDGLLAVPGGAGEMARAQLDGEDLPNIRAAAYVLLRLDPEAGELILARRAGPGLAPAILDALLMVCPPGIFQV